MYISLDPGAFPPTRAHATDAGLDIKSPRNGLLRAHDSLVIRTGVHVELPLETAGLMVSKSGLMTNHDITSTGLIDEGYDGEIVVKLFNHGDEDYEIRVGDKISQLVVIPVLYPEVVIVPHLVNGGPRGSHGFGSTGA